MRDYSRLTKAELIECLQQLETPAMAAARTPQDKAASDLHDTEERMRAILETAVEGIITIDDRGLIESINPAAERIFGYRSEEVMGKNVCMLMPSPYREEHDTYLANYIRSGHAKIIGIGREVVGQRKDGSIFPMDLAVSEVKLANRRLFTGFVRDITERKRGELRQRVQYATVAVLAESQGLSDGAPRVLRAICEIMGWRLGEFWSVDREAQIVHLVQRWHPEKAGESDWEWLAEGNACPRGRGLPGKVWASAKPEWVLNVADDPSICRVGKLTDGAHGALAFPIVVRNEVFGVMVFLARDLARPDDQLLGLFSAIGIQIGQFIERKRAEAKLAEVARTLAEKNKELETIVYVASHDLRSPLVNIQGFSAELARACEVVRQRLAQSQIPGNDQEVQKLLAEDIPEALEFILAGVKKMDTLLAGFLRFSRLGRAAIKPEHIQMNSMIASIVRTMDFQIKRAGAKVDVEPLPDCVADAIQLNQVFSNLLDNALKYLNPKRPGRIVVRGWVEDDRVKYSVADNGIGIAPEHQAKVFEIFHRLNPAHSEGEGLGLTIAQRILERQNGRIWVESKAGEGSTFFVALPV